MDLKNKQRALQPTRQKKEDQIRKKQEYAEPDQTRLSAHEVNQLT